MESFSREGPGLRNRASGCTVQQRSLSPNYSCRDIVITNFSIIPPSQNYTELKSLSGNILTFATVKNTTYSNTLVLILILSSLILFSHRAFFYIPVFTVSVLGTFFTCMFQLRLFTFMLEFRFFPCMV